MLLIRFAPAHRRRLARRLFSVATIREPHAKQPDRRPDSLQTAGMGLSAAPVGWQVGGADATRPVEARAMPAPCGASRPAPTAGSFLPLHPDLAGGRTGVAHVL